MYRWVSSASLWLVAWWSACSNSLLETKGLGINRNRKVVGTPYTFGKNSKTLKFLCSQGTQDAIPFDSRWNDTPRSWLRLRILMLLKDRMHEFTRRHSYLAGSYQVCMCKDGWFMVDCCHKMASHQECWGGVALIDCLNERKRPFNGVLML
jgi:hypothetical protein